MVNVTMTEDLVIVAKKLGGIVVGIAEDLMGERFTIAPYDDGFAFTGPAHIDGVGETP